MNLKADMRSKTSSTRRQITEIVSLLITEKL